MPDPSERPAPPIHLLLTGADCYPPSALPPLPELARALQHWQPQALVHSAHQVPLTLAEQLQADWLGLPGVPGHQPVAALEAQLFDQPCAWLTPCHEQLGMDRDDVSVSILERAKTGFLGIGATPARIRITYGPEEADVAAPAEVKIIPETPAAPKAALPSPFSPFASHTFAMPAP